MSLSTVNHTPELVLASGSPYRRQQLAQLQLSFTCVSPDIDEQPLTDEKADQTALRLAREKASAVAGGREHASLIIASDQTAHCDQTPLTKPGTPERAVAQLLQCSTKEVQFQTALVVLHTASGQKMETCIPTSVKFRPLSAQQIERYIARENPLDCAGSFKCEGLGIALFERIRSDDPSALVGLPLIALTHFLTQFGVPIL